MISVTDLAKSFGDNHVLQGVDLEVAQGEVVAVIGPSGSGKSTLLRSLNYLEVPDAGTVTVGDASVTAPGASRAEVQALRSKTAMVFQAFHLFRNRTALDNVADTVRLHRHVPRAEARERATQLLASVGITGATLHQYPATLSGGQSQRVSIARALAAEPEALLLDEPTSALDPELVGEVLAVIRKLAAADTTMVIVTHEMRFAAEVADRVVFMDKGVVVEEGPARQVINHPSRERTRQFLRQLGTAEADPASATPAPGDASPAPETSTDGREGPLTGLRVVEFTHFIAGPSAGMRLAELGADVVKVEPPTGDPGRPSPHHEAASHFLALNRGKRSVVLDLRDPLDEAAAVDLVRGADIVVHNLAPESMQRHGLDAESVRTVNPGVIYASVSGFPAGSSRAQVRGFDGIGQAESGMVWVNGTPDSGPLKLPYAPVDTVAGDMLVEGILAAVVRRLRTGEGSVVDVSLFEAGIHLQQSYWGRYLQFGRVQERIGNLEADVAPAAEILRVSDGHVIMSAYLPHHYEALAKLLETPELLTDPRFATNDLRLSNQRELHDIIQAAIDRRGWDKQAATEAFASIHIAHGQVNSYDDVIATGLFDEINQVVTTTRPDGSSYQALNAPFRLNRHRPSITRPAPALGAHTDEVRAEITAGQWQAPHTTKETA